MTIDDIAELLDERLQGLATKEDVTSIKQDLAGVKSDVGDLKTDIAAIESRLTLVEQNTEDLIEITGTIANSLATTKELKQTNIRVQRLEDHAGLSPLQ